MKNQNLSASTRHFITDAAFVTTGTGHPVLVAANATTKGYTFSGNDNYLPVTGIYLCD